MAKQPEPKRGRPPISGDLGAGKKTPIRNLRVPDDEWGEWQQAAERSEMSLSAWLRKLANAAAKRIMGKGK